MADEWYYGLNNQTLGPVTKASLSAMFASGKINLQTLVNREGMAGWEPLGNVRELSSVYSAAMRPPPPIADDWGIYNGGSSSSSSSAVSATDLYNQGCDAFNSGNQVRGNELWQRAADMGHASAQNNLGNSYYNATGVARDYYRAFELYLKSANQGNPYGQNGLANCYYEGKGVTKDYARAVEWYRKAAAQGHAYAQCNLGNAYRYGNGVPQSYSQAADLFRKAAAQGNANGQKYLNELKAQGKI